jgi:hypothetical protein
VSSLPAGIVNTVISCVERSSRNLNAGNCYSCYPLAENFGKNKITYLGAARELK